MPRPVTAVEPGDREPVPGVTIRPYRPVDHNACRHLWAEYVEHRDTLYGRDSRGDGGAGFEEYLTRLDLSGMWVACREPDTVVGLVGLTLDGCTGAVDPVVVTRSLRGRGIGRALLATVVAEAGRRGLSQLTVSPAARDHEALRRLRAAGFGTVCTVTLSLAVTPRGSCADDSVFLDLNDLRFGA